jgi:hypothetical protein
MREALLDGGSHASDALLLAGVVGGEGLETIEFDGQVVDCVAVGLEVVDVAGEEIAAGAGFGILGGAHDALDLIGSLRGVFDCVLAVQQRGDGAKGEPSVGGNNEDGEEEESGNKAVGGGLHGLGPFYDGRPEAHLNES